MTITDFSDLILRSLFTPIAQFLQLFGDNNSDGNAMKYLTLITLGIVFTLGGFFTGVQFAISKQEYKAEEAIGKEVALLEQYKNTLDCTKARSATNRFNMSTKNNGAIIWFYDPSSDLLKRLVVDQDFTLAYEEIDHYCATSN